MSQAVEKIKEILGKNLRRLRSERNLSQETLAERSNLAAPHLSQIERGLRWPRAETVEMLATALGISSAALFAGPEEARDPIHAWKLVGEFIETELSKKKTPD